jgi:protein-S-isoprenylcysteine O-methyltransferase Ste14
MNIKLEDNIGKALMLIIFGTFLFIDVLGVTFVLKSTDKTGHLWLVLISRVFGLIFSIMIIYFTILRLPPKANAIGIEPRISAIIGTFALLTLIALPTGEISSSFRVFSTILIVVGTFLSLYCLSWLGKSFSIMATARKLVTNGPYRIVRHPLYLAEAIAGIGIVISNWSIAAILVGAVHFAFQFRRMFNEEGVLRRTFPEYQEYAEHTPFIIPFSKRASSK